MGTGTSRHAGNCCFYAADSEPVPILSHALRSKAGRKMKSWLAFWLVMCGGLGAHSIALAAGPVESAKAASAWVGKTVDARGIGVTIEFDTSDAPDLKEWGEKAGKIAAEWYPKIDKLLASEGFSPPKSVEIRFRKDFRGLAATTGHTITIQPDWVRKHPDDFGMVVHELTHVVQQYPRPPRPEAGLAGGGHRRLHPDREIRAESPTPASESRQGQVHRCL